MRRMRFGCARVLGEAECSGFELEPAVPADCGAAKFSVPWPRAVGSAMEIDPASRRIA